MVAVGFEPKFTLWEVLESPFRDILSCVRISTLAILTRHWLHRVDTHFLCLFFFSTKRLN
jgi:hypothetical protein